MGASDNSTPSITRVVLGVTGGIAAYKAAEICSTLVRSDFEVRVAMTAEASEFIRPLTFEALSHHPAYTAVLGNPYSFEMEHISWSKWADLFLIAPATANMIAKLAAGICDDPVSSMYVAYPGPVMLAPAMNVHMLENPATQHNLKLLLSRGVIIIEPESGQLACGDHGAGRLSDVENIVKAVLARRTIQPIAEPAAPPPSPSSGPHRIVSDAARYATSEELAARAPEPFHPEDDSLAGRKILITMGPTHEYLDPVRYISNPSSGKMGSALAREAARRGAEVHIVSGPVSAAILPSPAMAAVHKVTTAEQMLRAVRKLAPQMDCFIFAAAVSDYRMASPAHEKIKRSGNSITLPLVENPDIAQVIGYEKRPEQVTIGFAAETHDVEQNAIGKLQRKRLDAIVANDVADPRIGFDRDENEVTIYLGDETVRHITRRPKAEVAHEIMEVAVELFRAREAKRS